MTLEQLISGNQRFTSGKMRHPRQDIGQRRAIAEAQHPFAAVLCCSDSRVPPEIIFDQGLGDLFTVRVAGHVADSTVIGTLEFAVEQLQVDLIVVLGHEDCGAVQAVVSAAKSGESTTGYLNHFAQAIGPASKQETGESGNALRDAIQANTNLVVGQLHLSEILGPKAREGTLDIVGAYYHLASGKVEWLPK